MTAGSAGAPSLRNVAEEAGVSVATASYVLNGGPRTVSEATRTRVLAAMRKLDYRPSESARSLRTGESRVIAILVPDVANPLYSALVRGVEDVARGRGFQVILTSTDDNAASEAESLRTLSSSQVRKFVVIPSAGNSDAIRDARASGAHVVVANRVAGFEDFATVAADDFEGGRSATTHLADLGHRQIAHLTGPEGYSTADARHRGYINALEFAGLQPDRNLVFRRQLTVTAGEEFVREVSLRRFPPTAVLVSNGPATLGVLRACTRSGISIPQDLSIVGYGDPVWSAANNPPLTVIRQPLRDVGREAGRILLDGDQSDSTRVVLPTELIVRASTCRPSA